MLATLKEILAALFSSKKFVALIVGLVATIAVKLGLDAEAGTQLATMIVGLISAYVLGQGVADAGKEAAKIKAASNETKPPPDEAA